MLSHKAQPTREHHLRHPALPNGRKRRTHGLVPGLARIGLEGKWNDRALAGGAAATMRVKRATRPGYTGPSEFTWRNRPRSFSMSTISGSMNRSRGKEAINSSAGAGLVASKRLNEKNTAAGRRQPHRRPH